MNSKFKYLRFTLLGGYLIILILGPLLNANLYLILAGVLIVLMIQIITKLFLQSKLKR